MSLNNPIPGGVSVAEFQVSPVPWLTSSVATGIVGHAFRESTLSGSAADMTYVSRWLKVVNKGSSALSVSFTRRGMDSGNFFTLAQNEVFQADLRVSEFWVSGSGTAYNAVAGLTGIQNRGLPVLSSSQGFPGVG